LEVNKVNISGCLWVKNTGKPLVMPYNKILKFIFDRIKDINQFLSIWSLKMVFKYKKVLTKDNTQRYKNLTKIRDWKVKLLTKDYNLNKFLTIFWWLNSLNLR
jgi:hypothetical protein